MTKINWLYMCALFMEPIFFYYSLYLFLCQYHTLFSGLLFFFFWDSDHMNVRFAIVSEISVVSEVCPIFYFSVYHLSVFQIRRINWISFPVYWYFLGHLHSVIEPTSDVLLLWMLWLSVFWSFSSKRPFGSTLFLPFLYRGFLI